jgi:hypothetical protein
VPSSGGASCSRPSGTWFGVVMANDFDAETYPGWWVRVSDQTLWKRQQGSPANGFRPETHCVVVSGGGWYYLTSAAATAGPDAPRTVAELEERKQQREKAEAEQAEAAAATFKRKQATAAPVTVATLDRQTPATLRAAVEAVEQAGGRVDVRDGRVVVSLPPAEVGAVPWFGGEKPARAAARAVYLAEEAILDVVKRSGRVDARKVPDVAILPSGRLCP